MLRFILMMICSFVLACSKNEPSEKSKWVKVNSTNIGTSYAHIATIHKDGNKAKISNLIDFKTPVTVAGDTFLSMISQWEYDCQEKLERMLYFVYYSENMGKGHVVYLDSHLGNKWESVSSDMDSNILFKIACSKQ